MGVTATTMGEAARESQSMVVEERGVGERRVSSHQSATLVTDDGRATRGGARDTRGGSTTTPDDGEPRFRLNSTTTIGIEALNLGQIEFGKFDDIGECGKTTRMTDHDVVVCRHQQFGTTNECAERSDGRRRIVDVRLVVQRGVEFDARRARPRR